MNLLQTLGRLDFVSPRQRKKLIWKILELLKFQDRPFEIDFYNLRYKGHTKNLIDRYVYFLGAYEKGMLNFIKKTLESSPNKVFVDIGANVGHHTIFASQYASHVFSFEPYEKVRSSLEEKIKLNNIKNVTVSPFALGPKDEELTFFEPQDFNTGTGSFIKESKSTNEDHGLKLTVRNATQLFEELGIKDVGLIKLDVESFEALVLKGLIPFLEKHKPVIIMEYSNDSQRIFQENPEIQEFIRKNFDMKAFNNPNKVFYKLEPWNFDRFCDTVLTPK